LLFVLLAALARGEKIPLWDGKELDAKVIAAGPKTLIVETANGGKRVTLHWDQVSRKFRLHPQHNQSATPDAPDAAAEEASAADDSGLGDIAAPGSPVRFTIFLVAVFVLFWSNLWALRVVDAVGPQDRMAPYRNLLALFCGIPIALFYRIKRRGGGGPLFESDVAAATAATGPKCQFYTWENEPLKPGRKASSGLHVAQEVFTRALLSKASDVHFNTGSEGVKVAMRVDGVLRPPEVLAGDSGRKVMAAIKMAAGMDVARRHETQDGACRLLAGDQWYDLRIARAWAVEGETLVVRILRAGGEGSGLTDFGMSQAMAERAADLTKETSGIIVLAGPTGSGKTTTIYSMLRLIEGTGRNILTIEDPVEHRLENATQISLNPKVGATFANALRASMRHDPDVILVGEIRDAETMNVAFQAALTGHLVFTTLHATGLLAVIGRLHELGLSAYMIKTGLQAVICQRLVRNLCPSCRQAYLPDEDELRFWGLKPENNPGLLFYKPQGCHLCEGSGYHGRTGVFRMVCMDNEVRGQIQGEIEVEALSEAIESTAMGTVPEYARRYLAEGVTSAEELRRTLGMFDFGRMRHEG
jgi:type II secretory ATPase GspE/PulE/Tfp pilus assembly ATPase PilB-like protein